MACNKPMKRRTPDGRFYEVPCGYCNGCRLSRVSAWAKRFDVEQYWASIHGYESSFVLLTYDDTHCDGSVHLDHIQKFLKLLRYHFWSKNSKVFDDWKYAVASEYAPDTFRPHYHAVFTGIPNIFSPLIQECWPYGFTYTRPMLPGSARYTFKYIEKCRVPNDEKDYWKSVGVNQPFYVKSKGVAFDYFLANIESISNGLCYSSHPPISVPRSFLDKYGLSTARPNYALRHSQLQQAKSQNISYDEWLLRNRVSKEESSKHRARLRGDLPWSTDVGLKSLSSEDLNKFMEDFK